MMKAFLSLLLFSYSLMLSGNAKADVPLDGFYEIDTPNISQLHPYFIISNGSLTNGSGFLFNPVCKDGLIQSPALVTDLRGFFEGYPVTRVIDKGNGHYLLTSSIEFDPNDNFQEISAGTLTALYGELNFDTPTEGTFTIRVASAFFTGEGMGTSTCLARADFDLIRVNN